MALLKWGQEDEENKDELFNPTPITTVNSVQNGAWQPTDGADVAEDGTSVAQVPQDQSYLLSDEKAQFDESERRKDAIEAASRAQAAEQADATRRAQAAEEMANAQADTASKYVPAEENKDEGFWGFLKDVGAGIQQGAGAVGDIAIQAGGVVGSIGKNDEQLVNHMQNVEKVRGWLQGQKDITGNEIVGTRDVEEAATRIATGQGTFEDFAAVGGKSLQAGIDSTMLLNPARLATRGLTPVASNGAKLIPRIMNNPGVRYAARDAAFYGGLQGGATTASTYGQTGDLAEALRNGAQDALIGGALQGGLDIGAYGARKGVQSLTPIANRTINSLRRPGEVTPAGNIVDLAENEAGVFSAPAENSLPQDGNVTFEPQPNSPTIDQPNQVIDGVETPTAIDTPAPVADGVVQAPVENPVDNINLDTVTPVQNSPEGTQIPLTPEAPVVADGVPQPRQPMNTDNMPTVPSEQVRQLQESRAGASQADEAVINQDLKEIDAQTPAVADNSVRSRTGVTESDGYDASLTKLDDALDEGRITNDEHAQLEDELFNAANEKGEAMATDSLPDDMSDVTPVKAAKKKETYLQRTVSSDASTKDIRSQLSRISGASGGDITFDEILSEIPKLPSSTKAKMEKGYATVEAAEKRINQIQDQFRKDAGKENGGNMPLARAQELAHERNRLVQDMQIAEKNISSSIRRVESRQSKKARVLNAGANLTSYSQGNMLASLPVQEKNIIGDIIASVTTAVQHPIKMATNIPEARLVSEFKRAGREVAQVTPQSLSEVPKYIIRSALSPVYAINNSLANVRGGMYRTELAKTELIKSGIKNPTAEQIKIQAVRAGNAREILVNLNKGVGSAMSDPYKAATAADEYFKVLDNGTSHKELAQFADNTRASTDILQGMMSGKGRDGKVTPMSLLINNLYPFINPAVNSFKKAIYQLDPTKASQVNQIRKVVQTPTRQNIARLTKMAGTAAAVTAIVSLLDDETIAYNDGDGDVSRPRGWSVKTGENTYMPARAFGVFEPFIVGTGVVYEVMNGNVKNPKDALKMAASSLPYLSSSEFYMQSVDEIAEGDIWGYGTQSQGVARTKNLVPFVNNGVERWSDRNAGKSTDSFSTYESKKNEKGDTVPDFLPWLGNSIKAGFGDTEGLKKSYTPAGQVRTADNQGAFVNKTMNDKNTATQNKTIANLVKYARDNEIGADAKEMFNTYDTGKNNNFKSVQDSITFLDAVDGKPDNAQKLDNNDKLGDLAAQIRDGFYGDTGSELLTLNGQNLKSDASMPNASGSDNSKLPLSMQSIKNAIAETDLADDQKAAMYAISGQNGELWDAFKNKKTMSYEQYSAAKSELSKQQITILSGSENYKKMASMMDNLTEEGFFDIGGIGSTKSGQTYLWNSLNALLGSKGATPAASYDSGKAFTPFGGGGGSRTINKPGDRKSEGIKWTPVSKREMAAVKAGKYTPVQIKVKLGNEIKKDKSQNYSDRTI